MTGVGYSIKSLSRPLHRSMEDRGEVSGKNILRYLFRKDGSSAEFKKDLDSNGFSYFKLLSLPKVTNAQRDKLAKDHLAGVCVKVYDRDRRVFQVMKIQSLKDQNAVRDFRKEIKMLIRLSSPHIVQIEEGNYEIYGSGANCHGVYYMEFCSGGSFEDLMLLAASKGLTVVMHSSVLQAVAYLHDKEVVHRDIKPGNVLLGINVEVKMGDFGLCNPLPTTTVFGRNSCSRCKPDYWKLEVSYFQFRGKCSESGALSPRNSHQELHRCTPKYLAPEIRSGQAVPPYSKEADTWGIAIMAVDACVGNAVNHIAPDQLTSQEQCEAFVAEVERVALALGATEHQHRFESVWRPILRGCLQFDLTRRKTAEELLWDLRALRERTKFEIKVDEKGLMPLEYQDSMRRHQATFRSLDAALRGGAQQHAGSDSWFPGQAEEARELVALTHEIFMDTCHRVAAPLAVEERGELMWEAQAELDSHDKINRTIVELVEIRKDPAAYDAMQALVMDIEELLAASPDCLHQAMR